MSAAPKRQPIPFGSYLLLDRINIGGMAEVWRGKQVGAQGFERLVAIKRILPNIAEDQEFITMFIDEAKITVQLTHANIAQVHELGHIQTNYFIAMEYIAGKDMRAIFDRCRKKSEPAPVPLTCYVVAKMCEGLDYAHRKKDAPGRDMNIVHRDVSPQNILISYEGEVKVIDFGIAKAAGRANKTQAGILKGKFAYMSPEQIRGLPLDRRSDIFAIGVCLFEMLTGERLFVGDSDFSVLEKVRKAEVVPPSQLNKRVPEALEKIVLKALAKEVEDRYQYASEIADDLQRFLITSDSIFSRKDLMQYMKSTFAEDVEREKLRMQEYAEIQAPPNMLAGIAAAGNPAPAPAAAPAPALPAPPKTAVMGPSGSNAPVRRSLSNLPKLTAAAPLSSTRDDKTNSNAVQADALVEPLTARPRQKVSGFAGPDMEDEPATVAVDLPHRRLLRAGGVGPIRTPTEPQQASAILGRLSNAQLLVLATVFGAVVLLAVGTVAWVLTRSTAMGALVIQIPVDLDGKARVNINGHEEDATKLQNHFLMRQVKADRAVVLVTAEGYEPFSEVVTVPEGKSVTIHAKLRRAEDDAELIIAVDPAQAEIRLDGKVVKQEGDQNAIYLGELVAGKDTLLEVRRAGYKKYSRALLTTSGATPVRVNVKLDPLDLTIKVGSEPKGALIFVGGREVGVTPASVTVPSAVAALVLRKRCYEELTLAFKPPANPGFPLSLNGQLRRQPGCR